MPVRVIHDGVDVENFTPQRPGEELRRKLSLPVDRKIVGYLGVLNEYQGIPVLLEDEARPLSDAEVEAMTAG